MTETSSTSSPIIPIERDPSAPRVQQVSVAEALQRAILLHRSGKLSEAESLYDTILKQYPAHADAHHLLGAIRLQQGDLEAALQNVEKAMELSAEQSFYYNTRGKIYLAMGRMDDGLADLCHAVELEPQNAEAHFNLAELYSAQGQLPLAQASYHRALTLRPIFAAAAAGYGRVLRAWGDAGGALPYLQLAASLEPDNLMFGIALASAFHVLGHLHLAIKDYQRLIEKHPDNLDLQMNLASGLALAGNRAEAIERFEKLRQQVPYNPVILDGLYEARRQACDWRDLDALEADSMRVLRASLVQSCAAGFRGFTVLYLPSTASEIRDSNRLLCQRIADGVQTIPRQESADPAGGRLRIGYLTADVREHPTAHLILDLFSLHDRERFECFLYSWAADDKSLHRQQIRASVEHFVECYHLPDKDIAERIAQDGVHVLIDLMGHTADNRLGVLARRPAPMQLGYLGYPGVYGGLIDYLLADSVVLPPDREMEECAEAVIRLPHTYQINSHRHFALGPAPTRSAVGLPSTGTVFCCMNNSYKIDPFVFSIWCRLLDQVPGSVLWLLHGPKEMVGNLRDAARERGIDPDRLVFAPRVSRADHLHRLQCADLFLDTRFYNAHTTATDALWAGVPVLTVQGHSFSARVAASLLTALGVPELILPDWDSYEAEALRLAQDPGSLGQLQERVRAQRQGSPLFDTPSLVADLERAYAAAWQARHGAPQSFALDVAQPGEG